MTRETPQERRTLSDWPSDSTRAVQEGALGDNRATRGATDPKPTLGGPTYITVSELNRKVKQTIAGNATFQSLWVIGELSNVRKNVSPHLFPKLKDESSEIGLVIWGDLVERYGPIIREGAKVLVHGALRVYEPRGTYQLYVDEVREFGVGELYAKFEALKKKLKDEGLFEQKRELPRFPEVVGIVTSPTGAAVQDMIRNLLRRYPSVTVILSPAQVQGAGAAEDISAGIRTLNSLARPRPDVIIVGRGGGSLEDLWAFNEEVVARALFESSIPTISAVGHQTDFTISDFVADRRAATPTEAAVDAVPDQEALLDGLAEGQLALNQAISSTLDTLEQHIAQSEDLLDSLNPTRILQRGYSVVTRESKHIMTIAQLKVGDSVSVFMKDGSFGADVTKLRRRK